MLRCACVSDEIFFSAWRLHIHLVRALLVSSRQQSHLCDKLLWEVVAVADGRLLMQRRMESVSVSGAPGSGMWHDLPVGAWRRWRCQGDEDDDGQAHQPPSGWVRLVIVQKASRRSQLWESSKDTHSAVLLCLSPLLKTRRVKTNRQLSVCHLSSGSSSFVKLTTWYMQKPNWLVQTAIKFTLRTKRQPPTGYNPPSGW